MAKVGGCSSSRGGLGPILSDNGITVFYPPSHILPDWWPPIHQLSHHLDTPPIPPPWWFSSQVKKALTLLEDVNLISSYVADTNLQAQTQVGKKHFISLFSNKETSPVLPSRKYNPRHSWVLSLTLPGCQGSGSREALRHQRVLLNLREIERCHQDVTDSAHRATSAPQTAASWLCWGLGDPWLAGSLGLGPLSLSSIV